MVLLNTSIYTIAKLGYTSLTNTVLEMQWKDTKKVLKKNGYEDYTQWYIDSDLDKTLKGLSSHMILSQIAIVQNKKCFIRLDNIECINSHQLKFVLPMKTQLGFNWTTVMTKLMTSGVQDPIVKHFQTMCNKHNQETLTLALWNSDNFAISSYNNIKNIIMSLDREDDATFECCVCMESFTENYSCFNCSHFVCEQCLSKLDKCPLCKAEKTQYINSSDETELAKKLEQLVQF